MKNEILFKCNYSNNDAKNELYSKIVEERNYIGYYNLPEQNIDEILEFADDFDDSIENIVVLGIGGSSLGAKAIYEFLRPVKSLKRKLYFFESTDPLNIASTLKELDINKSHFLIISKSGSTVETISIFKYIYAPNPDANSYTFITDRDSNLDKFAKSIGSKRLYLPSNVGGRFSVLSPVGLIPLALCGVDIKSLLSGAKDVSDSFFKKQDIYEPIMNKAHYYAKHSRCYIINCTFAYTETLKYFSEWYVQLWGESLGKKQKNAVCNTGLTPIGLIGPKDQHSFLQLIMEGKTDKTVTFIKVANFEHELYIPPITLKHLESLDILNNVPFHKLINMQSDSVLEALKDTEDIPLDEIIIDRVDENSIGSLIYYYELLTSLVGQLLGVNTYDQPGVEAGKIILKDKLTKV